MPEVFKNPIITTSFAASVVIFVVSIFFVFGLLQGGSGDLAVNFNLENDFVHKDVATVREVLILLGAMILINLFLVYEIFARNRALACILSVATAVASLIVAIALHQVVQLN